VGEEDCGADLLASGADLLVSGADLPAPSSCVAVAVGEAVEEREDILFPSFVARLLVVPSPFPLVAVGLLSFALEVEAFHLLSCDHVLGGIVLWVGASYLVEEDVDHQDLQEVETFWDHLEPDHASYCLDVLVGDIVCLEDHPCHQEGQEEVD